MKEKKDHKNDIPEGNKKTSISDKEKERIKKEYGFTKLSREEWIGLLNKHDGSNVIRTGQS